MQKAVELQSRGLTLRGMLHIPDNFKGKVPIVCIFHGFTGHKMEPNFIFVRLSRQLENLGIASVRFDFGGSGESDGDFIDMTISNELEDAKAILNYAKSLDFVNCKSIGVVGLSMGGVVSSLLARACSDDIKSLCLWAPASNIENIALAYVSDQKKMLEEGFVDVDGLALGKAFFDDVKTLDLMTDLNKFNNNVLIIHGDSDTIVPLNCSDEYLKVYKDKVKRLVIQDGDHTFNNLKWKDEVINYTVDFLSTELS